MDVDLAKPRTIKMKYPAPYSESWTENESPISKKKSKVHLLEYPLPFAKPAANGERKIVRPKRPTILPRVNQKINSDPFSGGPWQPQRPKIRGPDPTAPHLKYGLFTQKRNEKRSQMQMLAPGHEPKSRTSITDHSSKKDKITKARKGNASCLQHDGEAPMFVFRAIDPRYTRQLSMSPPTHVDIKPRMKTAAHMVASPLYVEGRSSTTFNNNNSPTLSIASQKKSFALLKKNNPPKRPLQALSPSLSKYAKSNLQSMNDATIDEK